MHTDRLVAWDRELREVHGRLRRALELAREAVAGDGSAPDAARDLLLYCTGFCAALDGHHAGEDAALFPGLRAEHPELGPVIDKLMQDHSMLSHLIAAFRAALDRGERRTALERHLDGIGAIMESHFRYEERQLLSPLAALRLDEPVERALGTF